MRKIVLTFGLIAGAIMSAMLLITLPFHDQIGPERGMIIGYTSMVIAFLLVFFGVRSYRDNVAGGTVGFGRALAVGAMIAAVASLCYVATWQVVYFNFMPDFLVEYQERTLERMRAEGESAEAIALERAEMAEFAEMYDNPLFNAAITFLEPLPVALIVALVSAGVLSRRRKKREEDDGVVLGARASA
jgi:hypothetical protein